jgi:hypothetical protein
MNDRDRVFKVIQEEYLVEAKELEDMLKMGV